MKPDSPHIRALVKRMEIWVQQGSEPTKSLQNFPQTEAVTRMLFICSCEKHPYTSDLQKLFGVWGYNSLPSVYYISPFGLYPHSPLHLQLKLILAICIIPGTCPWAQATRWHASSSPLREGEGSGQLISQASPLCLDGELSVVIGEEEPRAKFYLPYLSLSPPASAHEHTEGFTNCLQAHADDFGFPVPASKEVSGGPCFVIQFCFCSEISAASFITQCVPGSNCQTTHVPSEEKNILS